MRESGKVSIKINEHGGIVIDDYVAIDGHDDVFLRVVTHIHSDHTRYLSKSLRNNQTIVAPPLTVEWLKVMGYGVNRDAFVPIDYGTPIRLDIGDLKLVHAQHIPGTAQVVLEHESGIRVVYPSDFKKPGDKTPVIDSDILILDAVYGHPNYVREFDDYIEMVLADLVRELLSKGPVYIYGYYGKIQEVMSLLRAEGVDAPFVMSHRQYVLAKVAEKFGMKFGEYYHINSTEAEDVMRDGWFVYLGHSSRILNGVGSHVLLSGWEFTSPYRRVGRNRWLVAFSDHADFRGLVEYVRESRPKKLIVNRARSAGVAEFSKYIKRKLGIDVVVMP